MHNSLTMNARAGHRMDMKPWAPFLSPPCQNAQLTVYECQSRMQNGWAPFQSPTCYNPQLTNYECQSRMQNGHEPWGHSVCHLRYHISPWHVGTNMKAWTVFFELHFLKELLSQQCFLWSGSSFTQMKCMKPLRMKKFHKDILSYCIFDAKC